MEWWWNRGVERSKTKRGCWTFFNLHFLDQEWSKYLEFALAKLRGLCKYLANVYNSHSHVYGLHRLTFVHENKAEKSMQWGELSFKKSSALSHIKCGEVSLQIEFATLPPKPQPLYEMKMKRKLEKQGKCGHRLIVHDITRRGEIWGGRGGGGVKWRDSGRGGGGGWMVPLYQLISGLGEMVWQYI